MDLIRQVIFMDNNKRISLSVVKRLPRYYRYLGEMLENNIKRVSSQDLSKKMKVTASQIRQDLNNFGSFGQQGYGYNVELLYKEIQKILGLTRQYNLIIIGAGNIGKSLLNYINFKKRGFNFTAVFDIKPELVGTQINGIEVQHIGNLEYYLTYNTVDIAVLTMTKENTASVAEIVIKCGVKGILNFSHIDINAPNGVVIENVHLTDSLMILSYGLNESCGYEINIRD